MTLLVGSFAAVQNLAVGLLGDQKPLPNEKELVQGRGRVMRGSSPDVRNTSKRPRKMTHVN